MGGRLYKPGSQIDIWVVDRALGRGGMGSVYRCHNESAKRILAAVKVLEGDINANEDAKARFIREAEILFQLDHPNIVKVRNVRTDTTPAYIEMEFVEGDSLESKVRKRSLSQLDALDYVRQISGAIAYMHGKGVCHRDIKPANLLVTSEGVVKLVDFGLAMESDVTRITQHGMAFGTVSYAPPEWITPEKLDPKSWDIYALGVVFYEMLLGQLAFPVSGQGTVRQQAMQVIIGKQNAKPLDPGQEFHKEIRKLIQMMTEKDPSKRPDTAYIVYRQLTKIQEAITGTPSMSPALPHDPMSNWKTAASAPIRSDTPTGTPLPSQTVTLPPSQTWRPSILFFASFLFVITIALGVTVGAGLLLPWMVPAERSVTVKITGIPDEITTVVRLNDQSPIRADGLIHEFESITPGAYTLEAVIGSCNFSQCPGEACPEWCSVQTASFTVPRGRDVFVAPVELRGPSRRPLNITLRGIAETWIGTLSVNSQNAVWSSADTQFQAEPLLPGQYLVRIGLGACETEALGCHERSDCPPGCLSSEQTIDIPWGEGAHTIAIELPEPIAVEKAIKPSPKPRRTLSRRGGLVTHSEFSAWLGSNPDWLPAQAVAKNRAESGYLTGWNGTKPPAGKASRPVVNVSGSAAYQYCNTNGKAIPRTDEAPTSWTESTGTPSFEWRRQNNKLVLLDASGQIIPKVKMSSANQMTGFRCTK